jgi:putative endonuclease
MSNANFYVYILTNKLRSVFYVGVTNNLSRRISEHKSGAIDGFTKKYNVKYLIHAEGYESSLEAIAREKQLKHWTKKKRQALIKAVNPRMEELESW